MLSTAARFVLVALVIATAVLSPSLRADESKLDAAAIKALIAQLNSDDFRERAKATEQLLKAGDAAIGPLQVAAKSPHAEVAQRAQAILKKLTAPKFEKTATGLKYRILKESKNTKPTLKSKVVVHYTGWLDDGTVFDDSKQRGQPTTFPLNAVIKGWQEGLQLVGEGGVIELVIPPKLAYGERGAGRIPANATLHFRVELLEVK
ncbi:MAG: FKBP-type peptidyl-prolyl cis-trans isomerase [Pirellulales bacterium]|nr:FKBP-type peptidyl-prolyl cis-trans isomerase [Pirellulales bacterium]